MKKRSELENTNDISSIKRVTKTFLEVSRCGGVKQWQRMYKKCAARAKFLFLLIRPIVVFHRSLALPSRLALHDFILIWFEQAINIIESFAFRPWPIYYLYLPLKL